jgi:hypothetical protein
VKLTGMGGLNTGEGDQEAALWRLILPIPRDGFNMSDLDHYTDDVGGWAGGATPSIFVNISEMKLLSRP